MVLWHSMACGCGIHCHLPVVSRAIFVWGCCSQSWRWQQRRLADKMAELSQLRDGKTKDIFVIYVCPIFHICITVGVNTVAMGKSHKNRCEVKVSRFGYGQLHGHRAVRPNFVGWVGNCFKKELGWDWEGCSLHVCFR